MKHKVSNGQIQFRRWSRKPYAVFNSLKRSCKICVMSVVCSILTLKAPLYAASPDVEPQRSEESNVGLPDTVVIESVIVEAAAKPLFNSVSHVAVSFGREDIARLAVQDIQQLLRYVSGIDLRQRGGNGVLADINIRGGNYDQALILINGVNFTDPQTGHHNLNIPIDLSSVERIEILQGPGSRVLGPNAFSGAINIITTPSSGTNLSAKAAYGQHKLTEFGLGANITHNAIKIHAAAGSNTSTGYAPNTDFEIRNIFLHAQAKIPKTGELSLQSGFQLKSFGANGFYSLAYPDQFEKFHTFINSLSLKSIGGKYNFAATAYHRRSHDHFELFRGDAPEWYTGHNNHQTDILGINARTERISLPWKTAIGVDLRGEHIFSNVLGNNMRKPRPVPFEPAGTLFTKDKWRPVVNWFAEQSYFSDKFAVSAGLMGSYTVDYGHYTCVGLDARYTLSPSLSVTAAANQSLRLPTFTDLYYKGATNIGNKDLKPERAATFESGLRLTSGNFVGSTSLFYRMGHNIIDWVRADGETVFVSRNHISLNTFGVDADVAHTPSIRHLRDIRLSYSYLSMDKNNRGLESSKVMDYLHHKATLSTSIDISRQVYFSLGYILQQRAGVYRDPITQMNKKNEAFSLVDAKIVWHNDRLSIYAEGSNLFDRRYWDFSGLVQAGRWVKIGASVKIGK